MKKQFFISIILVLLTASFLFTGCSEECEDNMVTVRDTITNTTWLLEYNEQSSGNQMYYAPQSFIKNGSAAFASNLYHASNKWVSDYSIEIPKEININVDTDSLKLTARIRNINGDGIANEMDLALKNSNALMAYASWQKGAVSTFCRLGISGQLTGSLPELLTDPSSYQEYSLSVLNNQVTAYKNGTILKTVDYTGSVGKLEAIGILFRGYGEIDWVKLYKGNKLIMTEEFNVDGTTTAVWSKP